MIERRSFLSGLVGLPLVGGSVSLIGRPSAAAVPVTRELMESYRTWLFFEGRRVSWELAGGDPVLCRTIERGFRLDNPGGSYHAHHPENPSTRAAVVLAAIGCPLEGGGR